MKQTLAVLALFIASSASADPSTSSRADAVAAWWKDYAAHARLVPIGGGRSLNLFCEGHGKATILLESGLGDALTVWRKVQPVLARHYRVCAYDRAGLGESPPGPLPRDANAIVSDLARLIAKADLQGPYILVGHSFGGLTARLFARRHPGMIAGIVLVDPAVEGQLERAELVVPGFTAATIQSIERLRQCLLRDKPIPPQCEITLPDGTPESIAARLQGAKERNFHRTFMAEFEALGPSGPDMREVVSEGRNLGSTPLIVLTSEQMLRDKEIPIPDDRRAAMQKVWMILHRDVASYSARGESRLVPGTGHYIQFDNPESVVSAVEDVIARSRSH